MEGSLGPSELPFVQQSEGLARFQHRPGHHEAVGRPGEEQTSPLQVESSASWALETIEIPCVEEMSGALSLGWTEIQRSSSSFFFFFFLLFCVGCGLLLPGRLQQQWQQMKMSVRTTTSGSPRRTARQTVLKMPSWCLVTMTSQTELKKVMTLSMVLGWVGLTAKSLASKSWAPEGTASATGNLFLFQLWACACHQSP
uniref:Uncharacterized protein n=1 Tax=Spermophilus dauricus TaxID=99837 RepID=A0A8C9UQM5_SPEDA